MSGTFWTNTIWYILLAATSLAVLIIMFFKAPDRKKLFAFWFSVLGFTYSLEVSLLLILKAYTYYPLIQPDDPFFDAIIGNIFSQVSVSSSAVLICMLGLSGWWLAGFSVAYYLIDILFVQLGIYEHFWYRSVFTLAGFFVYGAIVKYWFKRVFSKPSKWVYYPTLFLSVFAVTSNLTGTVLKLLDLRHFQSALYLDSSRDHTATALIYCPVIIIFLMVLYRWKAPWRYKTLFFLMLTVCQWGLLLSGIIIIRPGWEIFILIFDLAIYFSGTVIMDRCLRGRQIPQA